MGRYGIIYSPSLKQIGQTDPYLTENEVRADANKKINAHWASLTAVQQQTEIVAYNKRKGITTPVPPVDTGKKAAQDLQRANTRATIISQLNSTGQSLYKGYKLVLDGNKVLIYDSGGNKLPNSFQSSTPTGENNINGVMLYIDGRTGTAGLGSVGYQVGNRIVFQRR
jgi:hypothetical protein